jgi:hypothetical protein
MALVVLKKNKVGQRASNFMRLAEWANCPTCGARFWRTHNKTIYCHPKCRGARLTPADWSTVNAFIAVCKRYHCSPNRMFSALTHKRDLIWLGLTRPGKYRPMSKERKDRYVTVLKKFLVDLAAGWYDIGRYEPRLAPNFFKRRMTPGQPHCPMNLPHCRGALAAPDCPRAMRECRMSGY